MRPSNNFSNYEVTWSEASKTNDCPLCESEDWCFIASNRNAAVCRYTDTAPAGWVKVKNAKDNYPIFVKEDALTATNEESIVVRLLDILANLSYFPTQLFLYFHT